MNPRATLMYHSPLSSIITAMNICVRKNYPRSFWDEELSPEEVELIENRILRKNRDWTLLTHEELTEPKHESVLEHLVYTFKLQFSRATLQELSRHRIASLSVESTRFCLKKMSKIEYYKTGNIEVDNISVQRINEMRDVSAKNDVKKYILPESAVTNCQWTINARSLRNWFNLRSRSSALKEIRMLSKAIMDEIPISHLFLYDDCYFVKEGEFNERAF